MTRLVEPELLDHLAPEDPRAVGSRGDLRRLNAWMGNARTVARLLRAAFPAEPPRSLVDLGAGDGHFMLQVARQLPPEWRAVRVSLLDRQATVEPQAYEDLKRMGWQPEVLAVDVLDWLRAPSAAGCDGIIANLFLHHFSDVQLAELFELAAARTRVFVGVEPRRSAWGLALCRWLWVIGCNGVTRHDAPVSVRAGFAGSELSSLWPGTAARSRAGQDQRPTAVPVVSPSPPLEERAGERRLALGLVAESDAPGAGAWSLREGPAGLASHAFLAVSKSGSAGTLAHSVQP